MNGAKAGTKIAAKPARKAAARTVPTTANPPPPRQMPSTRPYFSAAQRKLILASIDESLQAGRMILGPVAGRLEQQFRDYCGVSHAAAVSSCTAALEIVLRYVGVEGAEVILPTNTFVADANAVVFAGGTPVISDIDRDVLCLSVNDLARKISPRTKAVIVVHLAGLIPPRMDEILALCRKRKIYVIEDVAHAVGATYDGRMAGSLGDAACFSFYPTKVMTTATGGMITTRDPELDRWARLLRHHGAGPGGLTDVQALGNDWILNEISASLGVAQMTEIESMIERRREVAARYDATVVGLEGVRTLPSFPRCRHVYYKYPLLVRSRALRMRLAEIMKKDFGIDTGSIYYPPIHRQPFQKKLLGLRNADYPAAEDVLGRILCLPVAVQMTEADTRYVVDSLRQALARAGTR